jgi:hypothetical protein
MSDQSKPIDAVGKELAAALAKAQGSFPVIPKDTKVDVYSKPPERRLLYTYYYADLTTIIDCTRKALSENGLSFTQTIVDGGFVTKIMHSSGEVMRSGFVPFQLPQTADMKTVAGLITYVKRISLTAALGVSADEDVDAADDEGKQGNSTQRSNAKDAPKKIKNFAPNSQSQQSYPQSGGGTAWPDKSEDIDAALSDSAGRPMSMLEELYAFVDDNGVTIDQVKTIIKEVTGKPKKSVELNDGEIAAIMSYIKRSLGK